MLDLGSTEFNLSIPSVPERELRRLASSLFDSWEAFANDAITLPDYALFLQVEEGSVKGLAKVGAVLGAIYFGIGNYGDFVSGVKTINEQIGAAGEYLTEKASSVFSCPPDRASARKYGGALAGIQRLFVRVQSGELTPEEATIRAEKLLGDDAASEPAFLSKLAEAFQICPRHHRQVALPFPEFDQSADVLMASGPRTPKPSRRSEPVLGPPLHFRVEVWRESKRKRKQTRVIKL